MLLKIWGMKRDPETMGDTLGHYGVGTGSYLVLPIFGPSNIRDAIGTGIDTVTEGAVRGVAEEKLFLIREFLIKQSMDLQDQL